MNRSKYKRWRALLHGVVAKHQAKKRKDLPCVYACIGKVRKVGEL